MKKEKQICIRIGLPAFFALELMNIYRHSEGAHRVLAFPDFIGLLVGMGLEAYRKGKAPEPRQEKTSEEMEPLHLFDIQPERLHDMFQEFDKAIEEQEKEPFPHLRLVNSGGSA